VRNALAVAAAPIALRTIPTTVNGRTRDDVVCSPNAGCGPDRTVKHGFTFTPAFSFFVDCESEEEIGRLSAALSDAGSVLMPLGECGCSRRCAWISDRYGVSWQLNLA
jgi:hypothetical protein